ncbi:MAG: hypothetical protein RL088_991 [Verrucomicrobiota bacterium]|jgi:hypothetical protein
MNPNITRRTFFRGATLGAGTVLLAPFLNQLSAAPGSAKPKRFVFVIEGNGFSPMQAQPSTIPRAKHPYGYTNIDRLEDIPLAGHELSEATSPLKAFQDRLTIVQGMSGRICGGGHSNNFGALGAYSAKAGAAGETIDMALGRALPAMFSQIGLGISDRPEHTVIYNTSASGPERPAPTRCRPDLAYEELFGSAAEGAAKEKFLRRGNLLDFMAEDVKRVSSRMNGEERAKLDEYLGAFEGLRDRHSRLNAIGKTLREKGPLVGDKYKSEVEADRLDAMFDIGAASLICGLTNVVTLASGCGDPYFSVRWKGLGIPLDKHSIGHGKGVDNKTAEELTTIIRRFHMEQIARLATKLQSVREGDGTMLDNTCIIYLSDSAESHHSRCFDWPMLILGDLGGRIKTRGRFLCLPKYAAEGHKTTANFFLTLLEAAGAPRKTFGVPDGALRDVDTAGPISELLV